MKIARKTITPADKSKSAIVATAEIKSVLSHSGLEPEEIRKGAESKSRNYSIRPALFGECHEKVGFSYYQSLRETDVRRSPETRIGRIAGKFESGQDMVVIWNGVDIHFDVIEKDRKINEEAFCPPDESANFPGIQYRKVITAWARDNYIAKSARERANYQCEAPGCNWKPFTTTEERPYVEVHHIRPLSEGGPDSLDNCIALCPGCHAKAHYSNDKERLAWQKQLKKIRQRGP